MRLQAPPPERALCAVRAAIVEERAEALLHAQLVQVCGQEALLVLAAGPGAPSADALLQVPPSAIGTVRALAWIRKYLGALRATEPARWCA